MQLAGIVATAHRFAAAILARLFPRNARQFPTITDTPPNDPCEHLPTVLPTPPIEAPKPTESTPKPVTHAAASTGEFYFRETILDQLEAYMRFMGEMRTGDNDAYEIFSRIGARIIPNSALCAPVDLDPWFMTEQPSFGAVAIGISPVHLAFEGKHKDKTFGRFMYFHKYARIPAHVQRIAGGAFYALSTYFDYTSDTGRHVRETIEMPIHVSDDGTVTPLRMMIEETQFLRHRVPGDRRGTSTKTSVVKHQRWGISPWVKDWADYNKVEVAEFVRRMFTLAVNAWTGSHASMVQVWARNEAGMIAAFSVDITRTPYFFADRDQTLTVKGRKARIFHVVRPHLRTTRSGRQVGVRLHFAGLRRFKWNGYEIGISVPGWHHADLAAINAAGYLENDSPDGVRLMTTKVTGQFLSRHVRNGWQRLQRSGRAA